MSQISDWYAMYAGQGVPNATLATTTAWPPATTSFGELYMGDGSGKIEATRGDSHVADDTTTLAGEIDIFGRSWRGSTWAADSFAGRSWRGGDWNGSTGTGDGWDGRSWRNATWTSNDWAGNDWAGRSWRDVYWDGRSWRNNDWSGRSWRATDWNQSTWSSAYWG